MSNSFIKHKYDNDRIGNVLLPEKFFGDERAERCLFFISDTVFLFLNFVKSVALCRRVSFLRNGRGGWEPVQSMSGGFYSGLRVLGCYI